MPLEHRFSSSNAGYVDLLVGSPARRQTVVIDTGSPYTDFPCSDTDSSTFSVLDCLSCSRLAHCEPIRQECRREHAVVGGSPWTSYEASDDVSLPGDAASVRLVFGCTDHRARLSMCHCESSFWEQMHRQGKLRRRRFSLCQAKETGTLLTLGATDERLHQTPMRYTPMASTRSDVFHVQVRSVELRIGDSDVVRTDMPDHLAMLDSASPDTYLPAASEVPLREAWSMLTTSPFLGKKMANPDNHLPTLLFHLQPLEGQEFVTVEFPPSRYLEYDEDSHSYTSRIHFRKGNVATLGTNFFMGYDIMFDVEKNRIGFAESTCDYNWLVATEMVSFCSGWSCRMGMTLLGIAFFGGVVGAIFVFIPGLRDALLAVMRHDSKGRYEKAPAEIPLTYLGPLHLDDETVVPAVT